MMPADELAAIRARLEQATPGPWEAYHATCCPDMGGIVAGTHRVCESVLGRFGHPMEIQDAEFCAAARTDIPTLLADHDALVAENAHLRHALVALMSAATALRHAQRLQPAADLTPLRAALGTAIAAAEQAVGLVRPEAGPPDTAVPDAGDYATETVIHFRGCRCQECGEMNSMEAEYDA